ncbi:MAG: hypothetical protein HY796_07755 [Elusimicrobia bacterium]|nr:hypothetical protein [Elusimicrobiota bacterium]
MNCFAVGNVLDYFTDDRLTPGLREKVSAHLNQCPECAKEASLLRAVKNELSRFETTPLPERLRNELRKLISAESRSVAIVRRFNWRLSPAYGVALGYVALMLAASLFSLGIPTQAFAAEQPQHQSGGKNG